MLSTRFMIDQCVQNGISKFFDDNPEKTYGREELSPIRSFPSLTGYTQKKQLEYWENEFLEFMKFHTKSGKPDLGSVSYDHRMFFVIKNLFNRAMLLTQKEISDLTVSEYGKFLSDIERTAVLAGMERTGLEVLSYGEADFPSFQTFADTPEYIYIFIGDSSETCDDNREVISATRKQRGFLYYTTSPADVLNLFFEKYRIIIDSGASPFNINNPNRPVGWDQFVIDKYLTDHLSERPMSMNYLLGPAFVNQILRIPGYFVADRQFKCVSEPQPEISPRCFRIGRNGQAIHPYAERFADMIQEILDVLRDNTKMVSGDNTHPTSEEVVMAERLFYQLRPSMQFQYIVRRDDD